MCEDTAIHITARCAGFVETPNEGRKVSCHSPIQYFHRTARDFLEREVNWSRILSETSGTQFNPICALMRASITSLGIESALFQNQQPSAGIIAGLPKSLVPAAKNILVYACHGDVDSNNHGPQKILLDQLEQILSRSRSPYTNDILRFAKGFPTFLEMAAVYDLKGYVRLTVGSYEFGFEKLATTLLNYILPFEDCHVSDGLPLPSLEMVLLLLNLGADPNDACGSISAWRRLLFLPTSSKSNSYDPTILRRRYLQIMQTLVIHERYPEPKQRVLTIDADSNHSPSELRTSEIIKRRWERDFPKEARALLRSLEERTLQSASSTSQKRPLTCDLTNGTQDAEPQRKKAPLHKYLQQSPT